jgi:hypothetical protein
MEIVEPQESPELINEFSEKNFMIAINQKYFTVSLLEIINMVEIKSKEIDLSSPNVTNKIKKNHKRLRTCCETIKDGFIPKKTNEDIQNMQDNEDNEEYDKGKIIKKIYKILTKNIKKLYPDPQVDLFLLKNENNETVTIIPGCDIGLVIHNFTKEELDTLWNHVYMMYISSVHMISEINNHKKTGELWEVIPKLKEKVMKSGLIIGKDKKTFNPFIGLYQMQESGDYDVNKMFTNVEELKTVSGEGMTIEDVFKMIGIDNMININLLNEQLKNCKEEDINDATDNITKLLGAEADDDVKDVCHTLVKEIVSDLKINGLTSMLDTAKSISEKVGKNMDEEKMNKTAGKLSDLMANGEEKLKDMKDENGVNIGQQIFDKLKIPMQLARAMNSNSNKKTKQKHK